MPVISNINNIKSGITKTDISSIHPIHDMVSNQSRIHNFLWYYIDSINQNEFQFQNHEKINGKEHANYSSYPYQNSIRESQQQNNITNSNVLNDTGYLVAVKMVAHELTEIASAQSTSDNVKTFIRILVAV